MLTLRPYQSQAVQAIVDRYEIPIRDVLVLPTGCLAKNTSIPMWDGTYKLVQEVKRGDIVISYDEYSRKSVPGVIDEMFRTSLNPKPMLSFTYENETITTTYDHPFFNGEGFYPLYQLIWREMEESQRIQLELLCKQYGQTLNHEAIRGKHSCCNETCPRCERLLTYHDERSYSQSSQNCGRELVIEPTEASSSKSFERKEKRQQGGEFGMVYGKIQCLDWTQDRQNKNTNTPTELQIGGLFEEEDTTTLSQKHGGEEDVGEEEALRYPSKKISSSHTGDTLRNSYSKLEVKISEPYYSICMREAPYTYCIGKRNKFITHNSGKSYVIADSVRQLNVPTLVLQPSAEILEQNKEKLEMVCSTEDIGVYSASMGEKVVKKITLATIGSVVNTPELFRHFPLIIIDECHSVACDMSDTMYLRFLNQITPKKVVGVTATPFRLSTTYAPPYFDEQVTTIKVITRMRGRAKENFWNGGIIFNIPTQEMVRQGFLHRPTYFDNTKLQHESIPINKSKSDFRLDQYEALILPHEENILDAIVRLANISHSVLVFCTSVEQATRYSEVIQNSAVVSAGTKKKDRKEIIDKFKKGEIKVVLNVSCLTTGFDHPRLDGLVMIRPTRSLALYSQMIGRILRIHPEKKHARIVDFSGNVKAMGYAESIELYKNGNLPDIRTSKKEGWHGMVLYKFS
jgi:DNA repair protein RadD